MSRIWRQQPFEVLESWVSAIIDEASDELTDWEEKFIEDIKIRIDNKWSLTEKQESTLERIYSEKTK